MFWKTLLCRLLIGTLSKVHLCATVTTVNVVKFSTSLEYSSKKNTFAENQKSTVEILCNSSKGLCLCNISTAQLTRQIKHSQKEEVTKEKVNGPSCHYLTTNLVPNRLLGSGTSTTLSKKVKFLMCPWLHQVEDDLKKDVEIIVEGRIFPQEASKRNHNPKVTRFYEQIKHHGTWKPDQHFPKPRCHPGNDQPPVYTSFSSWQLRILDRIFFFLPSCPTVQKNFAH